VADRRTRVFAHGAEGLEAGAPGHTPRRIISHYKSYTQRARVFSPGPGFAQVGNNRAVLARRIAKNACRPGTFSRRSRKSRTKLNAGDPGRAGHQWGIRRIGSSACSQPLYPVSGPCECEGLTWSGLSYSMTKKALYRPLVDELCRPWGRSANVHRSTSDCAEWRSSAGAQTRDGVTPRRGLARGIAISRGRRVEGGSAAQDDDTKLLAARGVGPQPRGCCTTTDHSDRRTRTRFSAGRTDWRMAGEEPDPSSWAAFGGRRYGSENFPAALTFPL